MLAMKDAQTKAIHSQTLDVIRDDEEWEGRSRKLKRLFRLSSKF